MNQEFEQVFDAYLADELSDEQSRQFAEKLDSDPVFRSAFVTFMEEVHDIAAISEEFESAEQREHLPSKGSVGQPRYPFFIVIAASVFVLLAVGGGFLKFGFKGPVAMVVDQANAVFVSAEEKVSGHLECKRYQLQSGLLSLKFRNGVKMIVRGPADFEIIDEFRVIMRSGQARAVAPKSGHGFTIETPDADLVDLGTEFGVSVDGESGESRVQVFAGRVDVKKKLDKNPIASLGLGDVAKISEGRLEMVQDPSPGTFPGLADTGFARWQGNDQALRNDDQVVIYYPFEHSRENESILFDRSVSRLAVNGVVQGARWVTGRWPEKSALLFDQIGDAVQFELNDELSQFSVTAWIKVDRFDYGLTAIVNSTGWEDRDFHFQYSRSSSALSASVYKGRRQTGPARELPVGKWVHVASVVDMTARDATTWIDGELAVRSYLKTDNRTVKFGLSHIGFWQPPSSGPESNLPPRDFRGRVDEVVIWKQLLTADEIRKLAIDGRP